MTMVDLWGLTPEAAALVGVSAPVGDTVTTDQLADLLDLTPTRVQTLVRQGIIPQHARGRYDRRDAVRAYCGDMRKRAAGRGTGDAELTEHKRRLVREQADREGIRNATARGELVSAAEVEARWTSILTDVRSATLALPARIHSAMPHLSAADVVTIDRAVRDMLSEIGRA